MRLHSAPSRWARLTLLSLSLIMGAAAAEELPRITLESIVAGGAFDDEALSNLRWREDGASFTWLERSGTDDLAGVREYEISSGETRWAIPADALDHDGDAVAMSAYEWSPDRRHPLALGPQTRTWRNLREAVHYIHDLESGRTSVLAEGDPSIRNVQFSPDGRRIGYVRDHDIYVLDLDTGRIVAVTEDGSDDILNGVMDYVAAQALINPVGWQWSPEGDRILFWRSDITGMPSFHMVDELHGYNIVRELRYTIVGTKHAIVQIGVHHLGDRRTVWMDIGDDDTVMIPRVHWTPAGEQLAIQRMDRRQRSLEVLMADPASGRSSVILRDTDPAWVDLHHDLRMVEGEDRFVWTSERSGYRHAYLYDYEGAVVRQLTSGDWEITSVVDLDQRGQWLYFYGKKDSFIDQHVYRISLAGGEVERVSSEPGWYEWELSPTGETAIEVWSDVRTPPQTRLRQIKQDAFVTLVENHPPGMERYRVPHPEFRQIETSDGITLNVSVMKPTDFDPARSYPALAYGYGNAGSQRVVNRWGGERELWHRFMADQGHVVFRLDNRTTAGRGKAARNLTYGYYDKWSIHDQLEGARYLAGLDYVDGDRLGFWGWSGGGYLAAALMTKGEGRFRAAVSVAPVINLENYQSIGVERWMDTPADNPEGYYETNLENFADQLEGDLLLVHGTGDENVKYAFTLQFAQSLIEADKLFDMMIYPNEHHDLAGVRLHLYRTMTEYFQRRL